MSPTDPPTARTPPTFSQAVAEFLHRSQCGETVDRARFVRDHPHLARELESLFREMDGGYLRIESPAGADVTVDFDAVGSGTAMVGRDRHAGGDSGAADRVRAEAMTMDDVQRRDPSETQTDDRLGEGRFGIPGAGPSVGRPAEVGRLGNYEVLSEIARGGMGVVYRARQIGLNRTVALKMILSAHLATAKDVQRFRAEAEAAAHLQHPHIVGIHEVGEVNGQHYFTMDYVDGTSLGELVAANPLPPARAAAYAEKVASAVQFAHERGILHRDLKPSNVLLDSHDQPRVTDFGLAKRMEGGSQLTVSGAIVGTPSYMPPEQAMGRLDEVGPASDVYSTGAILYELLTARPPFRGESAMDTLGLVVHNDPVSPRLLNPKVPQDLETIVLKCLEKNPSARYSTAQEFAQDLKRFLAGEPILARPVGPLGRLWRWAKRKPVLAALWSALLVAIAIGLSGIVWQWRSAMRQRDRAEASLARTAQAVDELARMIQDWFEHAPPNDPFRRELLKEALSFHERLISENPTDPDERRLRARAFYRVADIHYSLGDHPAADNAYGQSIDLWRRLAQEYPDQPDDQVELMHALVQRGWRQQETELFGPAELSLNGAIEEGERTKRRFPMLASLSRESARAHYNRGIVFARTGRVAEAHSDYDVAVHLLTELIQRADASDVDRHELARTHINRGRLFADQDRPVDARVAYREAVAIFDGLLAKGPTRREFRAELAACLKNLGNLEVRIGSAVPETSTEGFTAPELFSRSIGELEALVRDFPSAPAYRIELSKTYISLSVVQDLDQALSTYDKARQVLEKLLAETPNDSECRGLLGLLLGNRAMRLFADRPESPASPLRDDLRLAIDHLTFAVNTSPRDPSFRHALAESYLCLSEAEERLAEVAEGSQAAELYYEAATSLSHWLSVTSVPGGQAGSAESIEEYAAYAVALLKKSLALRPRDSAELWNDPQLGPLRRREDFPH
jgi:serine/threonine protein kinase